MPAIELEVPVKRPDTCVGLKLGHPNQARISERHWTLSAAAHQVADLAILAVKIKVAPQEACLDQREQVIGVVPVAFQEE